MDKALYLSNMRTLRQFCGLTLADVSMELKVSHVAVRAYELGLFAPTQQKADKLINLFLSKGITPDIVRVIEYLNKRIREDK